MRWFPRLMVVTCAMQFVVYSIRPLLSYQALALGAGATHLGLITASFSVLSLVAAVPIGRAVDRWGELPFVVAGVVVVGGAASSLLVPSGVAGLAACSAALGLGHLSSVVGSQTLIAKGSLAERRDSRFAAFTVVSSVGQFLGPAVAGLIVGEVVATATGPTGSVANGHRVFVTAAGVSAIAFALAMSLLLAPGKLRERPPAARTPARASFARVMAVPSMPNAMLASLTVLSSIDLLAAYLPAYGEARGIPVRTIGLMLAAQGAASLVARLWLTRLIAALTRRRLLAMCMLVSAAAIALLPLVGSVPALFVVMIVAGCGLGLGLPITLGWVADQTPHQIRGTAMSVRLSGNRLGQTVVPALVGGVAGSTSLAAAFLSPAVLLAVGGIIVLRSRFRTEENPSQP